MSENLSERARQAAQILKDLAVKRLHYSQEEIDALIVAETLTLRQERDATQERCTAWCDLARQMISRVQMHYWPGEVNDLQAPYALHTLLERMEAAESSLSALQEIANDPGVDASIKVLKFRAALAATPQPESRACLITGKPVGTDTMPKGTVCLCANCSYDRAPEAPKAPQPPDVTLHEQARIYKRAKAHGTLVEFRCDNCHNPMSPLKRNDPCFQCGHSPQIGGHTRHEVANDKA
jgi:hypothetical protein